MKWTLQILLKGYQVAISPLLGPRCRFYPSCSQYAREVLKNKNLLCAFRKIIIRILKCGPWHQGGVDLP